MKALSENRFFPEKAENLKIKISDVVRARCDFQCILGVILSGNQF